MSTTNLPNENLSEYRNRLKFTLDGAIFAYELAKADQSARSSFKYKPHSYKLGDKVWINKTLFKDSYSKSQESDKLAAKGFSPFTTLDLVGKNAVRLDLPCHVKIHEVVNVMHTVPYSAQPTEIAAPVVPRPDPDPTVQGNEYVVDKILKHR